MAELVLPVLLELLKQNVMQNRIVEQTMTNNVFGPIKRKHYYILPQLEVAVFPKPPKVLTKVMNVPTVVHVMVKVVYAHVTKVIQANHAKHKPFWFKFAKKASLNSKQKEMYFHI
jgi:hypothetical protein